MGKNIGETPKEHRFGCSLACNLPRRVASGQTISSLRPGQKKKPKNKTTTTTTTNQTQKKPKKTPKTQKNNKKKPPKKKPTSFSYFQTFSLFILYCYAADSNSNE